MILYFDNYITNAPFHDYRPPIKALEKTRNSGSKIYEMPNKEDITLYTLASYAEIEWTEVVIRYELEDSSRKKAFEKEMKKIFPKAKYIYGRCDRQKKWQESVRILSEIDDDWIFYAGNNDHPFIAPELETLAKCVEEAKKWAKKYRFVSVPFSHFPNQLNNSKKGSPFHEINYNKLRRLKETKNFLVVNMPGGMFDAIQIVNKELFRHWFFSEDLGDREVRRSDCIQDAIKIKEQILVIPQNKLCEHFDAYTLKDNYPYNIPHEIYPPLFIPPKFFEKKIKVRYGYDSYKEGWVNINPQKEKYSFEDVKNGADLKISKEDIPLFWKKRIFKIDVNPNIDNQKMESAIKKQKILMRTPLKERSQLYYIIYRARNDFFSIFYRVEPIRNLFYFLRKNIPIISKIHDKSKNINHKLSS